jgi:hypothetical protein
MEWGLSVQVVRILDCLGPTHQVSEREREREKGRREGEKKEGEKGKASKKEKKNWQVGGPQGGLEEA